MSLNDNCLKASIVYIAEVKLNKNIKEEENQQQQEVCSKVYLGTAANTFKEQFRNHKLSLTNDRYKYNASLSKYIWKLKEGQVPFQVHWSAVGKAPTYTPSTKICHLSILEKTLILSEKETSLNQRSSIANPGDFWGFRELLGIWGFSGDFPPLLDIFCKF